MYSLCVCVCVCCAKIDGRLKRSSCVCVCVCGHEQEGGAVLTLELSEQMGNGEGHRLRGMCCLVEEDESWLL